MFVCASARKACRNARTLTAFVGSVLSRRRARVAFLPLDEPPPLGDLRGQEVEEDPHPRRVAQVGMGEEPQVRREARLGRREARERGSHVGDEAGEMADADPGLHGLSQPEHGVDLVDDALRRDVLADEPHDLQRREVVTERDPRPRAEAAEVDSPGPREIRRAAVERPGDAMRATRRPTSVSGGLSPARIATSASRLERLSAWLARMISSRTSGHWPRNRANKGVSRWTSRLSLVVTRSSPAGESSRPASLRAKAVTSSSMRSARATISSPAVVSA